MADKLDKKILYQLDADAFQSNSQIAKKVRASKQVVGYRIKRLEKQGIIRKTYPVYNLERLGYEGQKIYFQMQGVDKETEAKIIEYFQNHNKIIWFGLYEGRFDFVISLFDKNKVAFENALSKIIKDLGKHIQDYDIAIYSGVLALKKKYLSDKPSTEAFSFFGGYEERESIDEKNQNVLKILAEEARTPSQRIAEQVNLSLDATIQRLRRLKKDKLIQGTRLMLDKNALGIHEFKILLKLQNFTEETHKRFLTFAKMNPYIVAYIKTIGPWNLELDIEMPELEKFHPLIMELKTVFADSIKSIETLMLHDEYKYNFYPFDLQA